LLPSFFSFFNSEVTF